MEASLRRLAAPLVTTTAGAAAALQCGSLGASSVALRAAALGLRQLHGAVAARAQGGAAAGSLRGPSEVAGNAGAPRGYAAAQPAPQPAEWQQRGSSQGGPSAARSSPGQGPGSTASNGGASSRPKPRFLLERLGLAERRQQQPPPQQQQRQQPGAGREGGGGSSGGGGKGNAQGQHRHRQQHDSAGVQRRESGRNGANGGWAGGRPHERGAGGGRGPRSTQQPAAGRQPTSSGAPSRWDAAERPRPPQQPRGGPNGQAPAPWLAQRAREWAQQAQQAPRPARPSYQTSFAPGLPTAFPTAFPRMSQQQQGNHRRDSKKAAAAAQKVKPEAPPEEVVIPVDVTVLRLAQLLDAPVERVESVLGELGEHVASRHDLVSPDSAELAALEFGRIAVLSSRGGRDAALDADALPRPAVVTVMGHVDHGKTTLLDALRKTAVAAGEAGGITQHIGAFEVQMPGSRQSLTFLDTPGHAAFSAMRARGAAVTDLVVLVVAADDGVMPQTREAISHARAAGCPIVVAITKCDAPNAQAQRVRQQLVAAGMELEEVGGTIQVVEVSAVAGLGLDELEEALLLQAELMELKASRSRRGEAVVIEARVDRGQGPVATVVVKRGTLKVGQPMVVGTEWGRVRSLRGTGGKAVTEVLPGQPVEIAGLKGLPQAGDQLLVVDSEERAQTISRARTANADVHRRAAMARMLVEQRGGKGGDGEEGEGGQRTLPVIIKADVQGSAEAVREAVAHMATEHVRVQVVHVGVGPVSQSDVQLAVPLGAKILGFNVSYPADVASQAKSHAVEVRCQRVIYGLLEDVGDLLRGASPRMEHEVVAGAAEVLQTFQLKGARGKEAGMVAGCRVTEGSIKGSLHYRVLRGGEVVHTGACASLKRHKLEVETVGKGTECGVLLEDYNDVQPGDVLQCIAVEMRAATEVSSAPEKQWLL